MSEMTTTVLKSCIVNYAEVRERKTGGEYAFGGFQQKNGGGSFQSSFSYVCYDESIFERLLSIANKVADSTVKPEDAETGKKVTMTGYFQSRKPQTEGGEWKLQFIVTGIK